MKVTGQHCWYQINLNFTVLGTQKTPNFVTLFVVEKEGSFIHSTLYLHIVEHGQPQGYSRKSSKAEQNPEPKRKSSRWEPFCLCSRGSSWRSAKLHGNAPQKVLVLEQRFRMALTTLYIICKVVTARIAGSPISKRCSEDRVHWSWWKMLGYCREQHHRNAYKYWILIFACSNCAFGFSKIDLFLV